MRGNRRFSQAISEGDGISIIAEVDDADAARSAEAQGAEALLVQRVVPGIRDASSLPILLGGDGSSVAPSEADACLLHAARHDREGELERLYEEAVAAGFDPVVVISGEEELERVLELVDPEIVLLSARGGDEGTDRVLDLLPDVPAGKLAIAALAAPTREQVVELERVGVDAVLVDRVDAVAELVGGRLPDA